MGKHSTAITAALFAMAYGQFVPKSTQPLDTMSSDTVTRFYEVAENMFNMFIQTKFIDDRQDVVNNWFAGASEMMGTALNCEVCLGGMKMAQWFMASDFFVNTVVNFGDSLCYMLRNKFMYNSCSGYVESSVPAISEGLTGFLITPEYACEYELGQCVSH